MSPAPPSIESPGPATITNTPMKPMNSPMLRAGLSTERSPPPKAMIAANSGTVATRRPVSPDGRVCSAWPRSRKGPAISMAPNTSTQPIFANAGRSAFCRMANGSSSRAPRSVRPATTAAGEYDSTAMLMNRYGMPHSTAIAANSSHARVSKRCEEFIWCLSVKG